jgi:hypothetical protein
MFRITDHVDVKLNLAPKERVLGVYFNCELEKYTDAFVITDRGLHLLSGSNERFIDYDEIATTFLHMNKQDQARDHQFRYVGLELTSGEKIKVSMVGEYENGCLDFYNLDRFIGYMYRDRKRQQTKMPIP